MSKPASTDDENVILPFTRKDPEWLIFEKNVADEKKRTDPNATVEHNAHLVGAVSGVTRQIDVLVKAKIAGMETIVAMECKRYATKLGIGKVDEFAGKLIDLEVDFGILYAFNGLTDGAIRRAKNARHPKIQLGELKPSRESSRLPSWKNLLLKFGDCENQNCITGDVSWKEWKQLNGEIVLAGSCSLCGVWAVQCFACGEPAHLTTSSLECSACDGGAYHLFQDHNGGEEVVLSKIS